MNMIFNNTWLRLAAAATVATVAVVIVVGSAIRYYGPEHDDRALSALQDVRVVSLAENPALAEAIRKERERNGDVHPKNEPPPMPPPRPARNVSGFVHLEYTINPDGSVSDVIVIGAAPSGIYEQQAVEKVARAMHAPAYNDAGEAVARRATEIVDFSVPADQISPGRNSPAQ